MNVTETVNLFLFLLLIFFFVKNRDWLEAKLLTAGKVYSRTGDILDVDDAGEDAESSEPDR